MNVFGKTLGLVLASLALASCGGGGSSGTGGAFQPPKNSTITLSATSTTLPVNTAGYSPLQYGNPTQSTVTIVWRNPNGTLVAGQDVAVSISPPNVAALSCLVDGQSCTDGAQLFGSIPIKGINGQATIFVNAQTTAGTATLTVSGQDPTTKATVSASMLFTVTSGVGSAPARVSLVPSPPGVYLPGSGSTTTSSISATVFDGAGQLVPDPVSGNSGVDNIQFQIVGNAGDATLSSGSGSGTTVTSHTVHGVATVSFQAGPNTPLGPIAIRATVDRADNNVSNGIQDPVSFEISVIVSDGKLYSLVITSPALDSLQVNPPAAGGIIPNPDGTYSLTVSAQAQDNQGRPVTPGTPIAFGLIDGPLTGFPDQGAGSFAIAGINGNPQEGGTLFTAPTGQFTTAGGGAGAGDTLLVFGKKVASNDDLESARVIASINNATSLNVTRPFNPNDRGNVVDYGSVLPYVIGRAQEANITATAVTNSAGDATAQMTYPVSRLGKAVYIWAQANGGSTAGGGTRLVSAISGYNFVGEAPVTLSAAPSPIAGNTTTFVTVCAKDARNEALQGVVINFVFQGVAGQAILDGQSGSGTLTHPTGSDGCTSASVTTSGIAAAGVASVQFLSGLNLTTTVPISPVGNGLLLQVSPSALASDGGSVAIRVTGSDGSPQAGVGVTANCSGGVSSSAPAPTNTAGQTSADITNPGLANKTGGSCVYTAGGAGGPSATVTVTPPPTSTTTPAGPVALTLTVVPPPAGTGSYSVSASPGGASCSTGGTSPQTQTCAAGTFAVGTVVTITASAKPAAWTGGCAVSATDPKQATVTMAAAQTCTANF